MTTSNERRSAQPSTRSWWGRLDAVLVLAAFLGMAAVLPAKAQSASGGDPPSRVARLSDVAGQVWIYDDETNEWLAVERNRPLTTGDRIATDNAARAEITLGSTTLRLDAGTEIEIALLDDSRYVVRLVNGSVAARLRNPQSLAEFEIDTDIGQFRAQTVGRYRVDHRDQASDLTVFNGQAAYAAKSTALPVYTGQHAQFWIDSAGAPQYSMVAPARDAFSAWNDDRDRGEDRIVATQRFVSPEMTGAEDLGRYGQWQQTPDDGPVWVPTSVPVDWAPYSAGHWAFVRPWGWTWVDDAPWGFAPFHYGRWVYRSNVWCWAPGTYVARPVYAPALVAWIGGPRVGLSLSIGGGGPPVGWFPLAPREVYVPSYRASPRYVREVNITHVTNVTNITTIVNNRNGEADRREFANRRLPHAVTFVPSDVITRRQPVGPAAERFRNDPQIRTFVSDARPGTAVSTPPILAPVVSPRQQAGRQPSRPPFEGRTPGGIAGRPDSARVDPGRVSGARPDAGRPDGGRPEFARPGERPDAHPAVTGPVASPPPVGAPSTVVGAPSTVVGAPPAVAPRNDGFGRGTAQPGVDRGRSGREGTGPVGAPVMRDPAPLPTIGTTPIRPAPVIEATPPQRVAPTPGASPNPIPRGVPAGDGRVAPGLRGARGSEVGAPEIRTAPQATAPSPAPATIAPAATEGAGRRPERMAPPRQVDPGRAAEAARPAVVAPQVAAPAAVAPPVAAPRAPEARPAETPRPAEAARPVISEPRMNRPEAPRPGRDERRDDKVERPR